MLMLEIAVEHAKMFGIEVVRSVLCKEIRYSIAETKKRMVVHLSPEMPHDEAAQILFMAATKRANCIEPSENMLNKAQQWYTSQR